MCSLMFGILLSLIPSIFPDESFNCTPWLDLEKKLKSHSVQVNCIQYSSCLGIACEFREYGQEIHSSILVNNCENPQNLELGIDAPKLKVNHWQKKFYQGDSFSVTDNFGGDFEMKKVNNTFILGLTLQFHADKSHVKTIMELFPSVKPEIKYPFFENISIPIPPCEGNANSVKEHDVNNISTTTLTSVKSPLIVPLGSIFPDSNCTIANNSCPENEFCQQLNASAPAGICICLSGFVWGKSGQCIITPSVVPSTKSLLLTAILVPIAVILALIALVYATIRFRVCQKMRRRLRVQVYEHVNLADDVDDEQLNPVV
ncbi:hypothetical protein JTE90_006224 [Oedothorax gibbosus]|uniref:EGF-like domain-containing protein n=1 Tax=Oedothorax gibbosus TaxID=931172 RepID=A0AAV6VTJ6_9ARAC|nr:hypothetical protein JTE90_006224 [Oedothorax gibbosus]